MDVHGGILGAYGVRLAPFIMKSWDSIVEAKSSFETIHFNFQGITLTQGMGCQ